MDISYMLFLVQSLSHVQLFVTPWTAAHQASLSFTISPSLLKLMSIESVVPSNHLVLCHPLLLLPSIFPSILVFSNGSLFASGSQSMLITEKALPSLTTRPTSLFYPSSSEAENSSGTYKTELLIQTLCHFKNYFLAPDSLKNC